MKHTSLTKGSASRPTSLRTLLAMANGLGKKEIEWFDFFYFGGTHLLPVWGGGGRCWCCWCWCWKGPWCWWWNWGLERKNELNYIFKKGGNVFVMSPAVLLVRPPDKSVCQRLLLLLRPEVLLLLLLLVMEAVAGVRVETVLTTDALENENRTV